MEASAGAHEQLAKEVQPPIPAPPTAEPRPGAANAVVTPAENGLIGLHLLVKAREDGKPFDLIITDIHMPSMDGLELLRRVREDPDLRETPVLVITPRRHRRRGVDLDFARAKSEPPAYFSPQNPNSGQRDGIS
jgi:CheY-like chemotaxis protein